MPPADENSLSLASIEPELTTDHSIKGLYKKVLRVNKRDELYNEFRDTIQSEKRTLHGVILSKLKVIDGALYKGNQLWIPQKLYIDVIQKVHFSLSSKHSEVYRTLELLYRYYYWSGHKAIVRQFIRNCYECIRAKAFHDRQNDLL